MVIMIDWERRKFGEFTFINVGSIGYYEGQENVIVSSLYGVFQTGEYVDDGFLWKWFKADEFPRWIERLQEGSVR